MAIAVPIVIGAEELLKWMAIALGIVAAGEIVKEASKAKPRVDTDTKRDCPCPACKPPVGTVAYEVHFCPPSTPHWPCPDHHVHWFVRMQNPKNCQCFWKRDFKPPTCFPKGGKPPIPPDAVPVK